MNIFQVKNGMGKAHYPPHHEVIRIENGTLLQASPPLWTYCMLVHCLYAGPPLSLPHL